MLSILEFLLLRSGNKSDCEHEVTGSIPGLAQWLRIRHCHELWYRLQTQLRSSVTVAVVVAVAGSCSSN